MAKPFQLPIIDLSSPDRISTARSLRQACVDYGFFYLVNHGVSEELFQRVFDLSRNFFSLPLQEKMKLAMKEQRGYSPPYNENLDPASNFKGDSKELFHIGPLEGDASSLNQWPSEEVLPIWREVMEDYYVKVRTAGTRLIPLIALALGLEADFFGRIGALESPEAVLRLLHYPGVSDENVCGASPHTDYGAITLLATNGVPGLQVCRDKTKQPRVWEDVNHVKGAFIVNIGDLMERWTNCFFRSTLHRVIPAGQDLERYSIAMFMDPDHDCLVECLKSCCSESSPPRFPPIRVGDYLNERFSATYTLEA